jgi:hypothetical protein
MPIDVAYVLAQLWTHFNFFHIFKIEIFFPNPGFAICVNFQQENSLKN